MTWRCKVGGRTFVFLASLALWSTILSAQAGTLPPLYHFKGTVADPIGRPLGGARVTDGSQSTTTANDGSYSLSESSTGTFTLRASRNDTNQVSKVSTVTVPLDTTVNFTPSYLISGLLSPSYLSTAVGPAAASLLITSHAPNPGAPGQTGGASCVYVTDSRTGDEAPAMFVSGSTWSYALAMEQGTAEGWYGLSLAARDCSTNAVLSLTPAPSVPYVVDNTPPLIPLSGLLPLGHGNTMFASQPLSARITDGLSGVDPGTIQFTLKDLSAGTQPAVLDSTSFALGTALSPSVSFVQGDVYSFAVTARDRAGNVMTADHGAQVPEGFLAIAASAGSVLGHIEDATGTVDTSRLNSDGTYSATFRNVLLDVGGTTVTMSGSQHAGFGYIDTTVPLQSVKVCPAISNLLCQDAFNSLDPAWNPRLVASQFDTDNITSAAQTISIQGIAGVNIGTLTAHVPVAWGGDVYLTQSPVSLQPAFPVCSSPLDSSGFAACGSDPLRFFVPDGMASARTVEQTRMYESLVGDPPCLGTCVSTEAGNKQTSAISYIAVEGPTGPAVYAPNPCPSPGAPGVVNCNVSYPGRYMSIAPVQYAQVCSELPGQCSVATQSEGWQPSGQEVCNGPDAECYVVSSYTSELDHFTRNGAETQYQFVTGSNVFTCWNNCNGWQPGWRNYLQVNCCHDGVAMNWAPGPSALDWESAAVAIWDEASHAPGYACRTPHGDSSVLWYQIIGQYPVSALGPWGKLSISRDTYALGETYRNSGSYDCGGNTSYMWAWSWGVLADMYGNWNTSNKTTLYGAFEHTWKQTSWTWSFTYGVPSASPTPDYYGMRFEAPASIYSY